MFACMVGLQRIVLVLSFIHSNCYLRGKRDDNDNKNKHVRRTIMFASCSNDTGLRT